MGMFIFGDKFSMGTGVRNRTKKKKEKKEEKRLPIVFDIVSCLAFLSKSLSVNSCVCLSVCLWHFLSSTFTAAHTATPGRVVNIWWDVEYEMVSS